MPSKTLNFTFAGLACLLALTGKVQATPPDITFDCEEMPEICTNMCWAMNCANPTFPGTLTFDFPSKAAKRARRVKAGCNPSGNKCGTDKSGPGHRGDPNISCDEYPFASTKEADDGPQLSRCVPKEQNSKQGGQVSDLSKKWKAAGKTSFKINIGNPGAKGTNYCNNEPCKADGFEVQDGKVAKRDADRPMFKYYRTKANMIIASIDEVDYPSNFTRRQSSTDAADETFIRWSEVDDEIGEMHFIEDTIMEELPWDHFLN